MDFKSFRQAFRGLSLFLVVIIALFSCRTKEKSHEKITVFCASSLAPVMQQLVKEWDKTHEERIILNVASSGALARQITHGAKADIFLSANRQWVDYLFRKTDRDGNITVLAGNRLMVVVPVSSTQDSGAIRDMLPAFLTEDHLIAIGDPGHVPLGIYTKEALASLGIWKKINSHVITAKDARSTLRLVEWGEASFGIVYATDALRSEKVKIVAVFPSSFHDPIKYDGLLMNTQNPTAKQFLKFITSPGVEGIWENNGFLTGERAGGSEG